MFIIAVYDVKSGRTNSFKKVCRKYLTHLQKSVFEGEITSKNYDMFLNELKKLFDDDTFFKIYIAQRKKDLDFFVYGESDENSFLV